VTGVYVTVARPDIAVRWPERTEPMLYAADGIWGHPPHPDTAPGVHKICANKNLTNCAGDVSRNTKTPRVTIACESKMAIKALASWFKKSDDMTYAILREGCIAYVPENKW
jgi:hypothetical protein